MGAMAFIQSEILIQCLGNHSSRLLVIMTSNLSYLHINVISCSPCTKHWLAGWYWGVLSTWSALAPGPLPDRLGSVKAKRQQQLPQTPLLLTPCWAEPGVAGVGTIKKVPFHHSTVRKKLFETKVSFSLGNAAFPYDPGLSCLISVRDATARQMMAHSQVLWALSDSHPASEWLHYLMEGNISCQTFLFKKKINCIPLLSSQSLEKHTYNFSDISF